MSKSQNLFKEKLYNLLARLGLTIPPCISYFGGSDTLPAPMNREDEQRCIEQLMQGSEDEKSALIEHNLRLVV